jgi:hypothetical protein
MVTFTCRWFAKEELTAAVDNYIRYQKRHPRGEGVSEL